MLTKLHKTPFPWFGGKADAVAVWEALGDVAHYVEPFAGSLAVLLRRPHPCNRTYYSETVNDLDGYLVNVWRAIQQQPPNFVPGRSLKRT
jgi:DNA adenine methylase